MTATALVSNQRRDTSGVFRAMSMDLNMGSSGCKDIKSSSRYSDSRSSEEMDSSSKIIEEAKNILLRQPSYNDDMIDNNSNIPFPLVDYNQSTKKLIVNQLYSEYSTDVDEKASKHSKLVTFNLDKNSTHEYDPICLVEQDSSGSDSESDSGEFGYVNDASDLQPIDSQSSNGRVRVAFADDITVIESVTTENKQTTSSKETTLYSVNNSSESEKQQLQQDIKELREEYEEELSKLRKDYETRREDYMTELEEVDDEITRKRLSFGKDSLDDDEKESIESKLQQLKKEKEEIREFEEMLKTRKEYCAEQQQQVDDYEKLLDRRHESLTDKEEDLKTLQDELQELSLALRRRERELKEKMNRIEMKYSNATQSCDCDSKLSPVKQKVIELEEESHLTKEKLTESAREKEELAEKLHNSETENRRLQIKTKQLETQLSLQLRINEKHRPIMERRPSSPFEQMNGSLSTISRQQSTPSTINDNLSAAETSTTELSTELQRRQLSRTCVVM